MVIGIIGAGASGMAAALAAAESPENKIILMERQARVGRKLQATGNGRCNLTNMYALEGGYHGDVPEFSRSAISAFPPVATLEWFSKLGLFTVAETSGRVYPYSDQANSVVDMLRFALENSDIVLKTGCEIERIRKTENGFRVESADETVECDRLIIACGGLAGTKLGGTMSGYKLLRSMGHHCTKLRPALVQIRTEWRGNAALKGIRANASVQIVHNGMVTAESTGEIQFTEYGLSGPVIFEVSRDVCRDGGEWLCRLDFLPNISLERLYSALLCRKQTNLTAADLFTGILHNRLGRIIVQEIGIGQQTSISQMDNNLIRKAAYTAKSFEISLTEPMGMDSAQVTAGGIVTDEFDANTMQSRIVPGLYACGEVLDVDGDCGGYNLQWAWSSGRMAGLHAGGII